MTSSDALACAADGASLQCYLEDWVSGSTERASLASVVAAIAQAGTALATLISRGPLSSPSAAFEELAIDRRHLDDVAGHIIMNALRKTRTAYVASDEEGAILTFDAGGELAVAVNPLDGASNVDANLALATLFSIFPASPQGATASFFRKGGEQLAAGYIIYGPHTALLLTFWRRRRAFRTRPGSAAIPAGRGKRQNRAQDTGNRHQRGQLPPLAGARPRLYRRLRRRRRRTLRQRFQHSLVRLPGLRDAPHSHAGWRLSLSEPIGGPVM